MNRISDFIRKDRLPTIWCKGCGLHTIMTSIAKAVIQIQEEEPSLNLRKEDIALFSGIGCSGRIFAYMDFGTVVHSLHGRALPMATGFKLAQPNMRVIAVEGDGDALAIGGNHLIHTARRNTDITLIIANNGVYAQTGGQVAPTTPLGIITPTTPYGNEERPFRLRGLLESCGSQFYVKIPVEDKSKLIYYISQAILEPQFSVVEITMECLAT